MRVFVSYEAIDGHIGRDIVEACNRGGIEATSYNIRIRAPGRANVQDFIKGELNQFDAIVIVWSKSYAADQWLQNELFAAVSIENERKRSFIIPLCVDETPLFGPIQGKGEILFYENKDAAIDRLIERIPIEDQIFTVMAFEDPELDSNYTTVVGPAAKHFGFTAIRVDELQDSNSISADVLRLIHNSPVVLCEISLARPNVYFETGYARALNKEIIITYKRGSQVHFDIRDWRAIEWATAAELKDKLERRLEAIRERRSLGG